MPAPDTRGLRFSCIALALFFSALALAHYATPRIAVALWQTAPVTAPFEEQLARIYAARTEARHTSREIRIAFVGDIMLDRGVARVIEKYGGGDYGFPFAHIEETFRSFDLLAGNLEGPVSDKGADTGKRFSFRMHPAAAEALAAAGFDALSLANNHIGDWGREAMHDTAANVEAAGIAALGYGTSTQAAFAPRFIEVGETTVALIAASRFGKNYLEPQNGAAGIAVIGEAALARAVQNAAATADVVAVTLHFGEEYEPLHNAYQERVAHGAIDAGADLVVGHHPHVVQDLERYRDGWIAYSLGNFVFDQPFSQETMEGAILVATLENGALTNVELIEVLLNEHFQPTEKTRATSSTHFRTHFFSHRSLSRP